MSRPESQLWNNKREKEEKKKVWSKGTQPELYLAKTERKIMVTHGKKMIK